MLFFGEKRPKAFTVSGFYMSGSDYCLQKTGRYAKIEVRMSRTLCAGSGRSRGILQKEGHAD